jgi:hypothetical protein
MTCELSAIEIHTHLLQLRAERALASITAMVRSATRSSTGATTQPFCCSA